MFYNCDRRLLKLWRNMVYSTEAIQFPFKSSKATRWSNKGITSIFTEIDQDSPDDEIKWELSGWLKDSA